MIGRVIRLGGLPGLPGRVTLSAGVTICHVNVARWGNPNPASIGLKKFFLKNSSYFPVGIYI